jgi:hypothetical protein
MLPHGKAGSSEISRKYVDLDINGKYDIFDDSPLPAPSRGRHQATALPAPPEAARSPCLHAVQRVQDDCALHLETIRKMPL